MTRKLLLIPVLLVAVAACTGGAAQTSGPSVDETRAPATEAAPLTAPPAPAASAEQAMGAVTWDGKGCRYDGPTEIARGTSMTFSFGGASDAADIVKDKVAMLFMAVDDGITEADFDSFAKEHPTDGAVPKWVDQGEIVGPLYPEWAVQGDTMTHTMMANRYLVACATKDDSRTYRAAFIAVKDR